MNLVLVDLPTLLSAKYDPELSHELDESMLAKDHDLTGYGTDDKRAEPPKYDEIEAGLKVETKDVFDEQDSGVDPVYYAKARVLNDAFQEIGMGKYQVSSRAELCLPESASARESTAIQDCVGARSRPFSVYPLILFRETSFRFKL